MSDPNKKLVEALEAVCDIYVPDDDSQENDAVVGYAMNILETVKKEFEAYKAHRPETAPELKQQMPVAREMVTAFGIPSAELAGYEADDLIGTLARRGAALGYSVGIFTGDSDQLQLVTEQIHVLMTQRGVSEIGRAHV